MGELVGSLAMARKCLVSAITKHPADPIFGSKGSSPIATKEPCKEAIVQGVWRVVRGAGEDGNRAG